MKKMILKQLGLEEMMDARRDNYEAANHEIPLYIWDFLDLAKEGEIELMRHYMPNMVTHHSNPETQGWFVLYNLSATGRKPNELIVKADLRLRLGKEIPSAEEYRRQEVIEDFEEDEPALLTTSWEKYNIYEVDPELREVHRLLDTRFIPEDSLRRGAKWVDFDVTTALTRRRRDNNRELVELYIEKQSADRSQMTIDLRDSAALIVQIETPFAESNGPGYQAFQCRGTCTDMPPSARQNYTNHAVMQSLIHSLNSSAVPPPCCVPTEMSALSILFRDSRNITVVHSYPQMVVDACGCH
ncbi:hypothetical protein FO519_002271 [Halicephalobus sp. NKZ332]|nr:hypothetical protein FO519_002271 [Halicephalobus sp. NKZ332]